MFRESKFNGDISNWDVSNVTKMWRMFMNSQFSGDISKWDVSGVTVMDRIFIACPILEEYMPKSMNKILRLYKEDFATNEAWEKVCESLGLVRYGSVIEIPWRLDKRPETLGFDGSPIY
jgi:surface protein